MRTETILLSALLSAVVFPVYCSGGPAPRTYHVSNNGSDRNDGARNRPLRTIGRAAELAMPGETVLVMAGVYRERVAPARGGEKGKPIVYKGQPGKKVFIRGSEIWKPKWTAHAKGVWYAAPSDDLFDDRSPEYLDSHNPFKVHLSSTPYGRQGGQEVLRKFGGDPNMFYTCGQVFINGKNCREVPYVRELDRTFTWFYERKTGRIYVNFGSLDPTRQVVEITTRRRIFAPKVYNLGYIVVEGFIMEHCGNQYPTNFWNTPKWAQRGAVGTERGHKWIIRNNIIRHVKTFAIDAGYVTVNPGESGRRARANIRDNVIENNYILENGSAGILASGTDRMIIRGNVIMYNNTLRFRGLKRWEHAGIKCHNPRDGLIVHNYVADNLCQGIWLDNHYDRVKLSRNVIINNLERGIFLELSAYDWDQAQVDNNIVIGNAEHQIYTHDASGATFLHNLIANTKDQEIRGQGVFITKATDRKSISGKFTFYNNLFISNMRGNIETNYPAHTGAPNRSDYNVYDPRPPGRQFAVNNRTKKPIAWTEAQFKTLIESEIGQAVKTEKTLHSNGYRALMDFGAWKTFWAKHGFSNDKNSRMAPGNTVSYDRASEKLRLHITFDPGKVGSKAQKTVTGDFFGRPVPVDGRALPGPFQNLKKGDNVFKIWNGIPIPEKGWEGGGS